MGQSDSQGKAFQFHSINQLGQLEGQTGSAFLFQSINGWQYKTWFTGVGVGLDYYRFRSIPLFLDVRKWFGGKNKCFFIYVDGGHDFIWLRDSDTDPYLPGTYSTGFYSDLGIGGRVALNSRIALLLSAGYSHRSVEKKVQSYALPCYMNGSCHFTDHYDYQMNRLSIKAGFEF